MAKAKKRRAVKRAKRSTKKGSPIPRCNRDCTKEYDTAKLAKSFPEEAKELKAYCKRKCKETKGTFKVPPPMTATPVTAAKKRSFFSRLFRRG